MKKLISISLLLLLACGPSKEEFDAREKRKDDSLKAIQDVSNAMNDHNIIIDVSKNLTDHNSFKVDFRGNDGFNIDWIIIDDHKYIILATKLTQNISITHAGDCENSNHSH